MRPIDYANMDTRSKMLLGLKGFGMGTRGITERNAHGAVSGNTLSRTGFLSGFNALGLPTMTAPNPIQTVTAQPTPIARINQGTPPTSFQRPTAATSIPDSPTTSAPSQSVASQPVPESEQANPNYARGGDENPYAYDWSEPGSSGDVPSQRTNVPNSMLPHPTVTSLTHGATAEGSAGGKEIPWAKVIGLTIGVGIGLYLWKR